MDKPLIYHELGDRRVIARVIDLRKQGHLVDVGMDWTRHHAFERQRATLTWISDRIEHDRKTYPHLYYSDDED